MEYVYYFPLYSSTHCEKTYTFSLTAFSQSPQAADTPDAPRTFSSPSGHANSTPLSAPPPYTSDDAADETDDKSDGPKSAVSQVAASVTETAQMTYEELKHKLAQAEAQLVSLKDSGLRQRNVKTTTPDEKKSGNTPQAVKQQPNGVSVQIVALLCLLSFLLAYFFF